MIGEQWDPADNVDQMITVGNNKFCVRHFKGRYDYPHSSSPYSEYWEVNLPHQCDDFDVAFSRTSYGDAVKQMESFVAEAKLALEALKGMT